MSPADAQKRLRMEAANRTKMKNLHIFVSDTRLCIHNIPKAVDEAKLRLICKQAVNDPTASITECRIMRDLNYLNSNGQGRSRGFAFVAFAEHGSALRCLQALNNNPKVFSDAKRPIVEFSLENRQALNTKAKRMQNSKLNAADATQLLQNKKACKRTFAQLKDSGLSAKDSVPLRKPFPSHMGPKVRHIPRPLPTPTVGRHQKSTIKQKLTRKQKRANKHHV